MLINVKLKFELILIYLYLYEENISEQPENPK